MSFSHSFFPEQEDEDAEIHKGVNAVNTFVLFFGQKDVLRQKVGSC